MSARKRSAPKPPPPLPERIEFETFRDLRRGYTLSEMQWEEASCFNGCVSFRKFRVTIELIDEPVEVLRERIQELWDNCDNMHHAEPLRSVAASVGLELDWMYGKNRKSRA